MKKAILLLLLAGIGIKAQRAEVSAGYGSPSLYGLSYDLANALVNAIASSDQSSPSGSGVAAIGVMMYSKSTKWRYGIDIAGEFFNKTESVSKQNMVRVLPKVDYFWLNCRKLGLYSGGSIGLNFTSITYVNKDGTERKDSSTQLGYNIVPVGLRYGGNLNVFAEANIGMKGLLQAGVGYKF